MRHSIEALSEMLGGGGTRGGEEAGMSAWDA